MNKKEILDICDKNVSNMDIENIKNFIINQNKEVFIGIVKFLIELIVSVLGILLVFCIFNQEFSINIVFSKLPFLIMFSLPFLLISLYIFCHNRWVNFNLSKALQTNNIKKSNKIFIFSNNDSKKEQNIIKFYIKGKNKFNYISLYNKSLFIVSNKLEKNKEYNFYNINNKILLIVKES